MSDMVERVSKVMASAAKYDDRGAPGENDFYVCNWNEIARAAIEAMREPTDVMVSAGVTAETGKTMGERVTNTYREMVNAALKGGETA